jgi:hypothetical protein
MTSVPRRREGCGGRGWLYKVKLLSFSWGSVVSVSALIWFIRYIYIFENILNLIIT